MQNSVNISKPPKGSSKRLAEVRSHCAWIVDNYGPKLRAGTKEYGSSTDVLMGRLILAEDVLRIIDGDDRP